MPNLRNILLNARNLPKLFHRGGWQRSIWWKKNRPAFQPRICDADGSDQFFAGFAEQKTHPPHGREGWVWGRGETAPARYWR